MEPYFSCFLESSVSSEEKKLSFRTLIKIHPNFPRSLLSAQVCFDDASHARICSKKNGVYDVPRRGGASNILEAITLDAYVINGI